MISQNKKSNKIFKIYNKEFQKKKFYKRKFVFGKKHICMLCVFILVTLEPVLLCGCASARDGITMEFSGMADAAEKEPDADREINTGENMTEVSENAELMETGETNQTAQMVYIYVCGAVELPGVYCLGKGSRLYEAIEMAGGLTGNADDTCLNMAREIADGEQVVVLTQEETASLRESGQYPYGQESAAGNSSDEESGLVNINTADIAELTTVSGIGESRAQAIIAYREKNGSFRSIEDIKKVDGIKDGLFSKIKDKIKI